MGASRRTKGLGCASSASGDAYLDATCYAHAVPAGEVPDVERAHRDAVRPLLSTLAVVEGQPLLTTDVHLNTSDVLRQSWVDHAAECGDD